jgi:hypothetical protein
MFLERKQSPKTYCLKREQVHEKDSSILECSFQCILCDFATLVCFGAFVEDTYALLTKLINNKDRVDKAIKTFL